MVQQHNILLLPIKKYQETVEQTERIEYILKSASARLFYLRGFLKKYFKLMQSNNWHISCQLRRYFYIFLEGINSQKSEKLQNCFKKNVFLRLAKIKRMKLAKKLKQKQYLQKMDNSKLKLIFRQWKYVTKLEFYSKKLEKRRLKEMSKQFVELLKENRAVMKRKKLEIATQLVNIREIYCYKIASSAFQSFKINSKMQKIIKKQRLKCFKQFITHATFLNKQDKRKGDRTFRRNLLCKSFKGWKQSYQIQLASRSNTRRLIHKFLHQWRLRVPYLQSQKEIQANNEIIIKIYLEKRGQKMRELMFKRWKELTIYQKQVAHHNSILNTFAEKQNRYILLRRYFQNLKLHCLNNKVKLKYYQTKLKRKVIDAFKIYFQNAIQTESKVLEFMDKRYLKRYFQKIKLFNLIEKQKCRIIRLRIMFRAFTNSIIAEYCRKGELAVNFNKTNLLYKTIFILKKLRYEHKQQTYCIAFINIILPLRRMYKNFRFRRYLHEKEWFLKKMIIREWRMRVIRKDSQRKIVKEFQQIQSANKTSNSEEKLQIFEFENIMATIAQIRSNFDSERQSEKEYDLEKNVQYSRIHSKEKQYELQTPSQSINFSYSLQNL